MTSNEPKTIDPEPWMHRWPNDATGTRSSEEQCVVKGCVATHEPRSTFELKRLQEKRNTPTHWWSTLAWWLKDLWGNLRR